LRIAVPVFRAFFIELHGEMVIVQPVGFWERLPFSCSGGGIRGSGLFQT
jgi:hypothetical protein